MLNNSCITFLSQHEIHVNCQITIMAILELLPQPPGIKINGFLNSLIIFRK
jgi:hypothetical protein